MSFVEGKEKIIAPQKKLNLFLYFYCLFQKKNIFAARVYPASRLEQRAQGEPFFYT